MALRATRQHVEVLHAGDANLRVTRQFIEFLTIGETFVEDTITFTETITIEGTYNKHVNDYMPFLPEVIYLGGTMSFDVTDEMTNDAIRWDEEGQPYWHHYGLGDSVEYDQVTVPGETERIYISESVGLIHVKASSPNYTIVDPLVINDEADSMTDGTVDTLTITDSADVEVSKPIFETITFTETVEVEWKRVPVTTDILNIYQSVTYELIQAGTYCTYSPFVGASTDPSAPTPPSMVAPTLVAQGDIEFSYPVVSPTDTLTLRGPELGNRDRLDFQRIKRETRGGTLVVYANPIWPKIQMMSIDFVGLSESEAQSVLTFINTTLGKRIKVRDWEGREWFAFIKTPDNPIVRNQYCNIALSLELEVSLIALNPEVDDDITITDSVTVEQVHTRAVTDDFTITDEAELVKDLYWVGVDSSWNTDSNWSATPGGAGGAGVPNQHTDAHFDGNDVTDCTVDTNVTVRSINMEAGYTGHLDFDTYNLSLEDGIFAGTQLSLGDGVWTVTGDLNFTSLNTLNPDSSEIIMNGDSKTITTNSKTVYKLTINGATTLSGDLNHNDLITVNNVLTFTGITGLWNSGADLKITINGQLNGGSYQTFVPHADKGLSQFDGSMDLSSSFRINYPSAACVWRPGNYNSTIFRVHTYAARNDILTLDAGEYTFDAVQLTTTAGATGTLTIANNTNGPTTITINDQLTISPESGVSCDMAINDSGQTVNWILKGGMTVNDSTGTFTWTKGNGTITVVDVGSNSYDFNAQTIADLIIDSPDETVTFTEDGWTALSFLHKNGTVNFGGVEALSFTTTNDFTITADADVDGSSLDTCMITVNGDFYVTGSIYDLLDLHAGAGWTLDVAGSAKANYVDVDYSDASLGTAVTATNSSDGGNNTDWNF